MPICTECLQGCGFERISKTFQRSNVNDVDQDTMIARSSPTGNSDFIWTSNDFELPQGLVPDEVADGEGWEC